MMISSPRNSGGHFFASVSFWELALVLSFAAIFPPVGVHAGNRGVGTVAGTVVNTAGAPVPDASVTLQESDGGAPRTTQTDRYGRFFFRQLGHGYYDVRAYSDGAWSEWKHYIEVKIGKETEVRLEVVPRKKSGD